MRAIRFHQHGGPDVLKYEDAPEPVVRVNEVLVSVRACALNHLDLWVRQGLPNVPIPLPHIPGSDVSGEIAQTGAEVTTVRVGQKVVLIPGVTCGKCAACLSGQDNRCRQFTNLGYMIDGGCAEFVRAPEVNCLPYPENLSFEEAASIPLVFQTAWHMLLARAELQPGEDVLILGAGSGVGSAAIQIAKFFGARAIATTGYDAKVDLRFLFSRQLSLLGSYMGTKSELHSVMRLVASGRFKPIVDRIFPLTACADAHAYLESASQFGRVVLAV